MSVVVVKLNWNEAVYDSGIKLYNIYRNDVLFDQINELSYEIYDEVKESTIKYQITALTNDSNFLKSNEIYIDTLDVEGFNALNYTLNFDL